MERKQEVRVARFDVSVRVYAHWVEIHEVIQVVAQSSGATYYVVGKSLPYPTSVVVSEALEGAELLDADQPNEHWLLELLAFAEPLRLGEEHRFVVLHHTRRMAPMWTATSHHAVEKLTIRVRYMDGVRRRVWLIDRLPPRLLHTNNLLPVLEQHATELPVDRLASANARFTDLEEGKSCGLAWTTPLLDNEEDDNTN